MSDTQYKANDYMEALSQFPIARHHKRMLQIHYYAPNRTLTAPQMSVEMGYSHYGGANLQYGRLAQIIGRRLRWQPLLGDCELHILAKLTKPQRQWLWIMRPELAEALEQLGWVDRQDFRFPEEVQEDQLAEPLREGAVSRVTINAYERNPAAREECIAHYGCCCSACELILARKYGEAAQGLIHVHHLRPLAEINGQYEVDPIRDLRPVCPTCHAVIHSKKLPYTIEEIKELIKKQKKKDN